MHPKIGFGTEHDHMFGLGVDVLIAACWLEDPVQGLTLSSGHPSISLYVALTLQNVRELSQAQPASASYPVRQLGVEKYKRESVLVPLRLRHPRRLC